MTNINWLQGQPVGQGMVCLPDFPRQGSQANQIPDRFIDLVEKFRNEGPATDSVSMAGDDRIQDLVENIHDKIDTIHDTLLDTILSLVESFYQAVIDGIDIPEPIADGPGTPDMVGEPFNPSDLVAPDDPDLITLWEDTDMDGDADVTLVVGPGVAMNAVEASAQKLEAGSNGKLDIHVTDTPPVDGSEFVPITVEPLPTPVAGKTIIGEDVSVLLDPVFAADTNVITHELMHVAGVLKDGDVNNGESIMDYSYPGSDLTDYDKAMLQQIYSDFDAADPTAGLLA